MRPCGPEPLILARSTPASPARRRASGVTTVPPASRAGPKLRSGERTSRNGSILNGFAATVSATLRSFPRKREFSSFFPWLWIPAFAGMSGGEGAAFSPAPEITATTAPTGTVSPAATLIALSTPAEIAGTSIDTLSVSISNRLSPGFTASPALTNHFEILPSATVSPSCGIRTSMKLPRHRHVLRLEKLHQSFVGAFAADAGLLHAAEGRGGIGDEAAVQADHAELELLGYAHAAREVLGVEIRDQPILGVVGAP